MLTNEEDRNNDNEQPRTEFGIEDVWTLQCNSSNTERSWSAKMSTNENKSNSIPIIFNNNIRETINITKECLYLPKGSTNQRATTILRTPYKTGEVMNDEGRNKNIQETDSGYYLGYLETLTHENEIQKSWNAEVNTDKNKSERTYKISNNINESHACNSMETISINSMENFLGLPTGSLQQSERDTLEGPSETNLGMSKIMPLEESLECSDLSWDVMDPIMSFPQERMSALSASNENTGLLREVETPTTSTSNRTCKWKLITNDTSICSLSDPAKVTSSLICSIPSTGPLMTSTISDITKPSKIPFPVAHDNVNKSLAPTEAKSISVILPEIPCYSYESTVTTDCRSPDTTLLGNSTAVASRNFQKSEQQMKKPSQYSVPLATEFDQNFTNVSDNIYNTYTAYHPHQPISQILYNDHTSSSHQHNKEQCTSKYRNNINVGFSSSDTILTAVAPSNFINNEQQINILSEYSAPLSTEHQENFIPVSDNTYNIYPEYYPQDPTSGLLHKDQYFSSHQNNEREQYTYNTGTAYYQHEPIPQILHNDHKFIQNGYQNLENEMRANHYAQSQYMTAKLNNKGLQQAKAYHHMDALRCAYNCHRCNQPMSTQNSVICQQFSEIPKLDKMQNYKLYSTFHQAADGNIHNQQLISNTEHESGLPNTEVFQGEFHQQNLHFHQSHNKVAMQKLYDNNEEHSEYNWERQRATGYQRLPGDDRMQLTIGYPLLQTDGELHQPSSHSTENVRQRKDINMSGEKKTRQRVSRKCTYNQSGGRGQQKAVSKKCAKNPSGGRGQQKSVPKKCAKNPCGGRGQKKRTIRPDTSNVYFVCGNTEQYVLDRHNELYYRNSSTHE
jgi:hypothetical protein